MMDYFSRLFEKIENRTAQLCVVGLGRVGLPLAVQFAVQGFRTVGVDLDTVRVGIIRSGRTPFREPGLGEALADVIGKRFNPTADFSDAAGADVFILTVGTPLSDRMQADLSQLRAALAAIVRLIQPGALIVLRSTVPPGTLEHLVIPAATRDSGLIIGQELFVAVCPERIAEGAAMEELRSLPEICGAVDEPSARLASLLFQVLGPTKKVFRTNPISAELAKLFTNVYRYVMFALANEFAILAEHYGADAREIISIANEGYPRGGIPMPGPAGGPCLVKDGYLLVRDLVMPDFVMLAWKLNESVPAYIVGRIKARLALKGCCLSGRKSCVLGRGFKRNSDDPRYSPAERLAELLQWEGSRVMAYDPYFSGPSIEDALRDAEVVVLATNHDAFRGVPGQAQGLVRPGCLFVDCWGMFDENSLKSRGFDVITFGKGERNRWS